MEVPYFYDIMERSAFEGCDSEYKAPRVPSDLNITDVGINGLVGNIQHVALFYTTYVYVPGYATFDKPPSTPSFSKVSFCVPESTDKELRRNGFAG